MKRRREETRREHAQLPASKRPCLRQEKKGVPSLQLDKALIETWAFNAAIDFQEKGMHNPFFSGGTAERKNNIADDIFIDAPPASPLPPRKVQVEWKNAVRNIGDLLSMIELYPANEHIEYMGVNMKLLYAIEEPLKQLNRMVGMSSIKTTVIDQILYFIQGMHTPNELLHTVIYGPPGTGKTEVARLLGQIFVKAGVLSATGVFKKVTRADLVAGYLGQTAIKTKEVIESAMGGVLFIDEAYSLGNSEKRDMFSKECIDTLCEALSEYKSKWMVIVAGYETELRECFFSYNPGLESRFAWQYRTEAYSGKELACIFKLKMESAEMELNVEAGELDKWFEKNQTKFQSHGRDIENLCFKVKIAHSRRIFGHAQVSSIRRKITLADMDAGLVGFLAHGKSIGSGKHELSESVRAMFI